VPFLPFYLSHLFKKICLLTSYKVTSWEQFFTTHKKDEIKTKSINGALGGATMNRLIPLRIWGPSGQTPEYGTAYAMKKMQGMYIWDVGTHSVFTHTRLGEDNPERGKRQQNNCIDFRSTSAEPLLISQPENDQLKQGMGRRISCGPFASDR
jgi:hypothetical protein